MKFFIDTANVDEIRTAASWGVLDGVTTNPSLIAIEKRNYKETVKEICDITPGAVSAEVLATDYDGMVSEAREWTQVAENVVVKVPIIPDGIKAVKTLSQEGIKTNVTLVFNVTQAILAAKAGATYVSPFVGRIDDIGGDGMYVVEEILTAFANYGFETEVIVASVRHVRHVVESLEMGADIATIPFKVLKQLFKHPLTDIGIERFLADYKAALGD
ncbi:fructose-6-phosphate aldolase [bacterium]|nr:fructose-6-phosphate aldolase [bacterium]